MRTITTILAAAVLAASTFACSTEAEPSLEPAPQGKKDGTVSQTQQAETVYGSVTCEGSSLRGGSDVCMFGESSFWMTSCENLEARCRKGNGTPYYEVY